MKRQRSRPFQYRLRRFFSEANMRRRDVRDKKRGEMLPIPTWVTESLKSRRKVRKLAHQARTEQLAKEAVAKAEQDLRDVAPDDPLLPENGGGS